MNIDVGPFVLLTKIYNLKVYLCTIKRVGIFDKSSRSRDSDIDGKGIQHVSHEQWERST